MKITVVGSGGWGTALALLLVENGHDVTLWSHRPEKAEELRRTRENPMLKGVTLPEAMHFTADLACVADCGAVLMVTPSYAVRETAAKLRAFLRPGTVVISASKGIEKKSKTKIRSIALAMQELIENSDQVFLMGHRFGDLDSVGSACGLAGAVRLMQKPAYVVVNQQSCLATQLIDRMQQCPDGPKFMEPVHWHR